ncbi:MAG: isochorismatase hydrolase [uncultured bacterium]|nr:MAG: isochorismatase hydrolase [uncultured bacterium]
MKKQYYSAASVEQQAQEFLKEVAPLRAGHAIEINPAKVALLVIDLQKYFVDESSHAHVSSVKAIIPGILKLQNYCLSRGIPVIQTCHSNTPKDAEMMSKWWSGRLLERGDPMAEIIAEIANLEAITIAKTQYDAFYNSELESILKAKGIEQLIITGVMTHLCCETTARAAFTRGYEVFFCIDGTATYNRQFHLGALMNLAHGFAVPMLIDEVINQLGAPK